MVKNKWNGKGIKNHVELNTVRKYKQKLITTEVIQNFTILKISEEIRGISAVIPFYEVLIMHQNKCFYEIHCQCI